MAIETLAKLYSFRVLPVMTYYASAQFPITITAAQCKLKGVPKLVLKIILSRVPELR